MAEEGHVNRLLPIVAGLARRGVAAHVFTDRRFAPGVAGAGGRFTDLFAGRLLEDADDASLPVPCRFVTFAGRHAREILPEVAALRPALVVSDGFAVIGRVVAGALGLPSVNVCAGHNVDAARFRRLLASDPRVRISPECRRAVDILRERYGLRDASPFSYVADPSPLLNVYGEPAEYLTEEERRAFEPVVFFGSLPAEEDLVRSSGKGGSFGGAPLRIYASFGTVVWRYWQREALAAMKAVSDAVRAMPDARALLSLGGADVSPRELSGPNIAAVHRVDQWDVLRETDVFVTHQGLSSTHEAVFHRVPMVSYPFFWDQPALASVCRRFGFAVPLAGTPRGSVEPQDVATALAEVAREREAMRLRLEEGRSWELRTVAGREEILERIAGLCG